MNWFISWKILVFITLSLMLTSLTKPKQLEENVRLLRYIQNVVCWLIIVFFSKLVHFWINIFSSNKMKILVSTPRNCCLLITQEIFVVDRNAGLESVYAGDDGSQFEFAWVNPDTAILVILYSSGTTGLPKGVPLSHNNNLSALLAARFVFTYIQVIQSVRQNNTYRFSLLIRLRFELSNFHTRFYHWADFVYCDWLCINSDYPGKELLPNKTSEVVMLCLPMFHAFCLSFMYLVLTRGDTIVVMRKFSLDHFFRTTQQYRVIQAASAHKQMNQPSWTISKYANK